MRWWNADKGVLSLSFSHGVSITYISFENRFLSVSLHPGKKIEHDLSDIA